VSTVILCDKPDEASQYMKAKGLKDALYATNVSSIRWGTHFIELPSWSQSQRPERYQLRSALKFRLQTEGITHEADVDWKMTPEPLKAVYNIPEPKQSQFLADPNAWTDEDKAAMNAGLRALGLKIVPLTAKELKARDEAAPQRVEGEQELPIVMAPGDEPKYGANKVIPGRDKAPGPVVNRPAGF
jgi:hypothetical protein